MKGVLIGSDLMYRKDGNLVPIEINTNVGRDSFNRVESWKDVFELDEFVNYLQSRGIQKVALEGRTLSTLSPFLRKAVEGLEISVVSVDAEEFEEVAAEENTLAIRTFYDGAALVDSFCRDKIAFLDSLKSTDFEVEYLLKTVDGFKGEISTLEDNGLLPNFILKYRYPNYEREVYPKFYRFTDKEQLEAFASSEEMPEDFFLMPFYYCPEKLHNGERIQIIRNWSAFIPNEEGTLDSLYLGKYTKLCGKIDESKIAWSKEGKESGEFRSMLLSTQWYNINKRVNMLADEDDLIWMADGSWKEAKDLVEGDEIKTVRFPERPGVDIARHSNVDYDVTVEELTAESSYDVNTITYVGKQTGILDIIHMTFADDSDWYDTPRSSYAVLDPEDGTVMFKTLDSLKVGDVLVLLDDINGGENPTYVEQEIVDIEVVREEKEFVGLSCDNTHLFLSRTSSDAGTYISIEHNLDYCYQLCEDYADQYGGERYGDGCDATYVDQAYQQCLQDHPRETSNCQYFNAGQAKDCHNSSCWCVVYMYS